MYTTNTISYQHPNAKAAFFRSLIQGQWTALRNKLTGNHPNLEEFNDHAFRLEGGRKHLGLMNISVKEITGSVGRSRDFDPQFRPLKMALMSRWINAFSQSETDGKRYITVHKVGGKFFVKEGHNLVSVAKYLDKRCIQADVWEFSYLSRSMESQKSAVVKRKLTAVA